MCSLDEIIKKGDGKATHWRCETTDGVTRLYHYSTLMLEWSFDAQEVTYVDVGNGSQSDQNGMNRAFRILGLPWTYKRSGGARIVKEA